VRQPQVLGALAVEDANGTVRIKKRNITLLMLSGGVDSTYTLVKLLTETTDIVLAHHVHLLNREGRHDAEARACRAIVAWCRQAFREFAYTETAIDHRNLHFYGFDMISVGFEAGLIAHNYLKTHGRPIDRWMIGICKEETNNRERWPHVVNCVAANCYPGPPPRYFQLPVVTKAEMLGYLPQPLLDRVWTCRHPVASGDAYFECGTCATCLIMKDARAQKLASSQSAP